MTDDQLRRCLQSVGMTAFVTHLALFEGNQSNADAAADLQQTAGWTAQACRSRISTARRLLRAGRRADALQMIVDSRLPDIPRKAARAAM